MEPIRLDLGCGHAKKEEQQRALITALKLYRETTNLSQEDPTILRKIATYLEAHDGS